MSSRTGRSWARAALLAGVVLALDQAVKALVRSTLERGTSEAIVPGIDLVHTRNTGVAFGALAGGGPAVTLVVGVALAALVAYFSLNAHRRGLWLPTGLLLGGALGNVTDRLRDGAVTDFIKIPILPAFNVADMAITAGVVVLLVILERRGAAREA